MPGQPPFDDLPPDGPFGGDAAGDGEVEDAPAPARGGLQLHQRASPFAPSCGFVRVGDLHCPLAPGLGGRDVLEARARPLEPCPSTRARFATLTGSGSSAPSPSIFLRREPSTPTCPGVVGAFLNIAPILLHGGSSCVLPPTPSHDDWFKDCVESELAFGGPGTTDGCAQGCLAEAASSAGAALVPTSGTVVLQSGDVATVVASQPAVQDARVNEDASDAAGCADAELPRPSLSSLIDDFRVPLSPPLLLESPIRRVSRAASPRYTSAAPVPRRSSRLAQSAHLREPKLEAQARKVLLKKWRPVRSPPAPPQAPHSNINGKFRRVFREPLSASKSGAMREVFPAAGRRVAGVVLDP